MQDGEEAALRAEILQVRQQLENERNERYKCETKIKELEQELHPRRLEQQKEEATKKIRSELSFGVFKV